MPLKLFLAACLSLLIYSPLVAWDAKEARLLTSITVKSILDDVAAGRQTVSVTADSESEAMSTAERQHPGWTAEKATKTSKGKDKNALWSVTMTKK